MKPSVTTVLNIIDKGKYFEQWAADFGGYRRLKEYVRSTADRGERTHINCTSLMYGLPVMTEDMERDEAMMVMAFKEWVEAVKPEFKGTELALWHPDYPVAGTLDVDCVIKGIPFILDIKTTKSHHDTHGLQLTAYGRIYELIYGIKPEISVLKLSMSRGQPKYEVKRYAYQDEALANAIALWKWRNPNKVDIPKPRREIPTIIQLEKEIITLDEEDYVKEPKEPSD
jgi:hypothetical protein